MPNTKTIKEVGVLVGRFLKELQLKDPVLIAKVACKIAELLGIDYGDFEYSNGVLEGLK